MRLGGGGGGGVAGDKPTVTMEMRVLPSKKIQVSVGAISYFRTLHRSSYSKTANRQILV